jgi:outer membrane receptor protein involved in Fe transport
MKASRWTSVLAAAGLAAAAEAAEIRGRATDRSGGALAGAQIELLNVATQARVVVNADGEGRYRFAELAPGPYRVEATAEGFSEQAKSVSLAADASQAELDFELALGHLQTTLTVTAARSTRDTLAVPMRAESISVRQIQLANPASAGDLMTQAPGITPVASGPFQVRPRLRGLDSTRVLVLVDGERLNNARTATDRAGIEVGLVETSSIESIEVVSGSGSVLYGTDALSGTIDIRTAQPTFGDAFRVTAGLNGYYGTNEDGRRGALRLGASGPRFAVSLSAGLERFDDYRAGGEDGELLEDTFPLHAGGRLRQADTIDDNFPPFAFRAFPDPFNAAYRRTTTLIPGSGSEGENTSASGLLRLRDEHTLRVTYRHRKAEDVGFPDFAQPQFFQRIALPESSLDKVSARYETTSLQPWFARLAATAYWQRQDRLLRNVDLPVQFPAPTPVTFFPINVFRLLIDSDTRQTVGTYGLDVQNTFVLSPANVLIAGVTAHRDRSEDNRTSASQMHLVGSVALGARGPQPVVLPRLQPLGPETLTKPVRVPNASFRNVGVFVQDEWDVTSRLRLVAGLRLDSYGVSTDATPGYDVQGVVAGATPAIDSAGLPDVRGDSIGRSALTGELGAVYKLGQDLRAVARYGRSYRHPNLEELLFAGPATVGSIAPNVRVGPEKGDNVDLGLKLHKSGVRGSLSYFNNTYNGFISTEVVARTAASSVSQAINFAKVRIQGVEGDLEASAAAGPLVATVFGRGAYNRGEVLRGRNPLTGTTLDGTPQDNITPFKLMAGARFTDRKSRLWAEYSLRHQKRVDRVAATLLDSPFLIAQDLLALPGFTVHRAGAGCDWRRGRTRIGLSVNVENLANRYYREQFQFAPARGRSLTFGVNVGTF